MSTHISIHNVTTLKASTHNAVPHITITADGDRHEASADVTFFLQDEVLIGRLVEAINAVAAARATELLEAEMAA